MNSSVHTTTYETEVQGLVDGYVPSEFDDKMIIHEEGLSVAPLVDEVTSDDDDGGEEEEDDEGPSNHIMAFSNPMFRQGLNIVIRGGSEWNDSLDISDILEIVTTEGCYIGEARVLFTHLLHWDNDREKIEFLLKFYHDEDLSGIVVLERLLAACYGEKDNWYPYVSVVGFNSK